MNNVKALVFCGVTQEELEECGVISLFRDVTNSHRVSSLTAEEDYHIILAWREDNSINEMMNLECLQDGLGQAINNGMCEFTEEGYMQMVNPDLQPLGSSVQTWGEHEIQVDVYGMCDPEMLEIVNLLRFIDNEGFTVDTEATEDMNKTVDSENMGFVVLCKEGGK